jgi:hypothetical protein
MTQIEFVYCSRCRRKVKVTPSDGGHQEGGHANVPDTRYVCLDFGAECEGPTEGAENEGCPVFGVLPAVIGVERARAGLTPEPRATLTGRCRGCGGETVQEVVGSRRSVCGICGSVNQLA